MVHSKICWLFGIVAFLAIPNVTFAGETGIAAVHQWVKVGSKTCINNGHFHHGEGIGRTEEAAEAQAIRVWVDFTSIDYGSDWATYGNAWNKTGKCEKTSDNEWKCSANASPCKTGRHTRPDRAAANATHE